MSTSAMKQALEALERGRSQIIGVLVQQDQDDAITALRQAIEQAEKQEPVAFRNTETGEFCTGGFLRKDWATWQPLYAAPVHASDMSQERVDETAKREHEFECPRCGHCCQQREWVGLDDDIPGLGLVTEEFYNGMLCAEDILRKRNT